MQPLGRRGALSAPADIRAGRETREERRELGRAGDGGGCFAGLDLEADHGGW